MGIPAYFSQIIKNHSKIIKHVIEGTVHCLLIDANSIIYDVVHSLSEETPITDQQIVQLVIEHIQQYIDRIKPTELVFIAFDGIAPVAKMEQQKTRRYKTAFLDHVLPKSLGKDDEPTFNTMVISPGTPFMNLLAAQIDAANFTGCPTVIKSTSAVWGEGEHKLFKHLRENPQAGYRKNIVVYGLDADLIMLSLFHQKYCGDLYVCRERPAFGREATSVGNDTDLLYLDIPALSRNILGEMALKSAHPWRIYDYIFMCFFLGNDFLPAFPALNIRTYGIQRLMDTYRGCIGHIDNRRLLSESGQIQWKWVRLLIKELAKNEREFFIQEAQLREQWETQTISHLRKTKAPPSEWLEATPVLLRTAENYVCPTEPHWERRYEAVSFPKGLTQSDVVTHYLQGLEWVTRYYTGNCYSTVWKYPYAAAPLLSTLYEHSGFLMAPHAPLLQRSNHVYTDKEQLAAIIPPAYYNVVGLPTASTNNEQTLPKFTWAYKRYFWEAHLV
jgi:5'-3' exonuclease